MGYLEKGWLAASGAVRSRPPQRIRPRRTDYGLFFAHPLPLLGLFINDEGQLYKAL